MENQILKKMSEIEHLCTQLSKQEILSFKEGCKFLDLSPSYVYKLTHYRKLVHFKPGGKKIYFKRSDLEAWLLRNRVKTADEIEQQAEEILNKKNMNS